MRISITALMLLLITPLSLGQWSVPVQITRGPGADLHPVVADAQGWLFNEEWLAFSRDGKNICIVRSEEYATRWSDSVSFLTTDSADNDFPSLAWGRYNQGLMLLWQSRRNGNLDIWYSRCVNDTWQTPLPLTLDPADDRHPCVTLRDSVYVAVWERQGRIMYSQYSASAWSPPVTVTPPNDTLNARPRIEFLETIPVVVWQKQKFPDTTFAIMYSYRTGNSWTPPDTIAFAGDNRDAVFFKATPVWYGETIAWVQPAPFFHRILTRRLTFTGGVPSWDAPVALIISSDPVAHPAVNGYMILVNSLPAGFLWFSVASWQSLSAPAESIAVTHFSPGMPPTMLSAGPLSGNRNPDVSSGRADPRTGFGIRFWSVWESDAGGNTKLWGSNILLIIAGVRQDGIPSEFALHQNYPNPFNPSTTITYTLTPSLSQRERGAGAEMWVSLKVYDVLGREVATLVDEVKNPGAHSVTWDAGKRGAGTYFYQLRAGWFVETRRMVLVR